LRERISTAVVVEHDSRERGTVGFGSTVVVRDQGGVERTWRIVSSRDASPAEGRISADSPVARALLGRHAGDDVSVALPRGESVLSVLSVN
jgi:transcription elongation GreA/GreB family factor